MNNSIYLQLISLNKKHTEHYLRRYVKLVSFYKERNWSYNFGFHEHHIVPESFGGLDTTENLVCITIREHFILHWILYKAFPKSQMTTAFHIMCNCWGKDFRITSKVYQNAMLEFIERNSEMLNKKVLNGTHPWQDKEKARERENKRVTEGTHPWQGDGEFQRQIQNKRIEDGSHHLLGKNQIKIECEYCKKIVHKGNFTQHHGNNCKLNPLFEEKEKVKIECPHCHRYFSKSNFTRYHNDNCKLNPLFVDKSKPKILCEHCKRTFDEGNYLHWHGDNCKLNSLKEISNSKPKIECPHCNRYFYKSNFLQFHGDKCKLKPQI